MHIPTLSLPRPSWRSGSVAAALLLVLATWSPDGTQREADQLAASPSGVGAADAPLAAHDPGGHGGGAEIPDLRDAPASGATGGEASSAATGGAEDAEKAAPQQVVTPAPRPEQVQVHEPDLLVRTSGEPLPSDAADLEGTDHLAGVRELTAATDDAGGGGRELDLLAVDATTFRPLTPDVTAQSAAVWERLDDGDAVVRHDVAHELGLELGGPLELRTGQGSTTVRVGALAANGAPPFADVLVPFEVAASLGSPELNAVVVSAVDDPEALVGPLGDLGDVELRRPPEPERTTSRPTDSSVELEPFTYTSRGDGTIAIHGDWAQRNIVRVEIPGMGASRCHRAMVPQLYAALQEIIDEGLYEHFDPDQFGGCWVPRHIMFNPDRGLSMHAWGLAIDFNVQDNWYGKQPEMDPRIVEIFERWGFEWGGRWSTPDGMHFEVARFVQVE